MKHDLKELVHDVLLSRAARQRGLFDPKRVDALVRAMDRDFAAPERVWTLLILELWFQEVAEKSATMHESMDAPPSSIWQA
jgi:hypothetical protein